MSPFDYDYIEHRAQSFDALALVNAYSSTLTTGGEPLRLRGARISPSFFRVFGVRPAAGRVFADDDVALKDGVAMISSRLWRERFNSRPDIINAVVQLDARPWTIVGGREDTSVLRRRAEHAKHRCGHAIEVRAPRFAGAGEQMTAGVHPGNRVDDRRHT